MLEADLGAFCYLVQCPTPNEARGICPYVHSNVFPSQSMIGLEPAIPVVFYEGDVFLNGGSRVQNQKFGDVLPIRSLFLISCYRETQTLEELYY